MANDADQRNLTPGRRPSKVRLSVERALAELRRGAPVVLADGRGDTGCALVVAAETAAAAADALALAGTVPVCVVAAGRAEALGVGPCQTGNLVVRPAGEGRLIPDASFYASVAGIEGDVVPADRLAAVPADRLQDAALDLVKLARLVPAAVVARVAGDAGPIIRDHDLLTVSAAAVERYRADSEEMPLTVTTHSHLPLENAEQAEIYAFRPADGGKEHLAIVIGRPQSQSPVLTRIHSECFTGDLLGSLRCDCGQQLRGAIRAISEAGGGVLLYLAQEGRGIGLVNKLRAYALQDQGFDTIEANERLGFDADERVYRPAAAMLRELGYAKVRLLTNNPSKVDGLAACGIEITDRVPHAFPANGHNERYLRTKASRAGHIL